MFYQYMLYKCALYVSDLYRCLPWVFVNGIKIQNSSSVVAHFPFPLDIF